MDSLREAAELVYRTARSKDDPQRVTLDNEALYSLGVALYGENNPEVQDLRRNIDAVTEVAQGDRVTMGQLVDRLAEFPVQEDKS